MALAAKRLDLRILRKPVQSFVTPQLRFHPIERTLLCQTGAQSLCGLAAVAGHVFEFVLQFFVGYFDFFFGGDAVDDQFGLHIILGAVFLLRRRLTQSTFTARGSTPCWAKE